MSTPLQVRLLHYGIETMFLAPKQALPPVIWGVPGCAKTAIMKEIAERGSYHLEHVTVSDRNPEDIGGTPMVTGEFMRRYPPDFVWGAKAANERGQKAVIFVDEMTTAQPPQQAPLMRGFHECKWGDSQLDRGMTAVAGAANPPELAANGSELASALANRCFHISWPPFDTSVRTAWKLQGESVVDTLPRVDPELFQEKLKLAQAHICAFLTARPSLKNSDPLKAAGQGYGQFASDRMWDAFEALYATCMCVKDEEAISGCAEGTLGGGIGLEFSAWLTDMDLPDPEDVLAGKAEIPADKARADRTFAALLALVAAATQQRPAKEYSQRWHKSWEQMDKVMHLGKDIIVVPGRVLSRNQPSGGLKPEVQKIIAKLTGVVREAGMLR